MSSQVLEVRPLIDWDKGKAVEFLLDSLGIARLLALLLGSVHHISISNSLEATQSGWFSPWITVTLLLLLQG